MENHDFIVIEEDREKDIQRIIDFYGSKGYRIGKELAREELNDILQDTQDFYEKQ